MFKSIFMLYKKRERFSRQSEALGKYASKIPLSANNWTVLSIITAFITAFFIINNNFFFAATFFAITAILDVIDGAVARHKKSASPKGAYIDTITDRYVEFIILGSLVFVSLPIVALNANAWIFLCILGGMMTTYAKSAAKEKELVKQELCGGLLERGERMILLFLGLCVATISLNYLVFILILYAVLSNVTALQRIHSALKTQ